MFIFESVSLLYAMIVLFSLLFWPFVHSLLSPPILRMSQYILCTSAAKPRYAGILIPIFTAYYIRTYKRGSSSLMAESSCLQCYYSAVYVDDWQKSHTRTASGAQMPCKNAVIIIDSWYLHVHAHQYRTVQAKVIINTASWLAAPRCETPNQPFLVIGRSIFWLIKCLPVLRKSPRSFCLLWFWQWTSLFYFLSPLWPCPVDLSLEFYSRALLLCWMNHLA